MAATAVRANDSIVIVNGERKELFIRPYDVTRFREIDGELAK